MSLSIIAHTSHIDKHFISANKSVFKRGNEALPSLFKPPFLNVKNMCCFFPIG